MMFRTVNKEQREKWLKAINGITKKLQLTADGWKSLADDAKSPGAEDEPGVVGGAPTNHEQLDASRRELLVD